MSACWVFGVDFPDLNFWTLIDPFKHPIQCNPVGSWHVSHCWTPAFDYHLDCVGCDIVQADHAPDGGVAQGIFHGILVKHHGRNQEEVEEGLGKEVEGQEEEDAQTTACTCMDGMR